MPARTAPKSTSASSSTAGRKAKPTGPADRGQAGSSQAGSSQEGQSQEGQSRTATPAGLAAEIGKSEPFDLIEEEVYLNLTKAHERFAAEFNQLFKAHGLSGPKYNALRILRGHETDRERGIACQKIAEQLITREPDITRLLDRLLKDGLVSRERCEDDRRVVLVRITPAGRELVDSLDEPIRRLHKAQLGHLSARDLQKLNDLLYMARFGE